MSTQPEKQIHETVKDGQALCLSRRDFLRTAGLTMAGLSAALLLPQTVQWLSSPQLSCKHCNALFQAVPEAGEYSGTQPHCPNCGINLATGRFDLELSVTPHYTSRYNTGKRLANMWNCTQVPFPNSQWVLKTDKPSIQFSDIHL